MSFVCRRFVLAFAVTAGVLSGVSHSAPVGAQVVAAAAPQTEQWGDEIDAFEASDRVNPRPVGPIVFVGSSSIRLWPHLQDDFPGVDVLQRGFGGAELSQVVHFAPRIVIPYKPRLVVLYAGDNDLFNGKSPQQVLAEYVAFVSLVRAALPKTQIAFVSIKPSPARWDLADNIRRANSLVKGYATTHPGLSYVDIFTPMLGTSGLPRPDLFEDDQLHLNAQGYAIWRDYIEPVVRSLDHQ